MKSYGIDGNLHKWFTSYLHNRKQRTKSCFERRVVITIYTVLAGVPQGSVFGLYFYYVYQ